MLFNPVKYRIVIAEAQLRVIIEQDFSFSQLVQAHALSELDYFPLLITSGIQQGIQFHLAFSFHLHDFICSLTNRPIFVHLAYKNYYFLSIFNYIYLFHSDQFILIVYNFHYSNSIFNFYIYFQYLKPTGANADFLEKKENS